MFRLLAQVLRMPLYRKEQRHRRIFDSLDDAIGGARVHAEASPQGPDGLLVTRVGDDFRFADGVGEQRPTLELHGVPSLVVAELAMLQRAGSIVLGEELDQ